MKQITLSSIACLAALAAVLVLSCPAGAQAPAGAGAQATIAMVDIQKAAADYKGMKAANDEINKLVNDLKTDIEARATHKLMTESELTELVTLKKKTPRTDPENKRMDELEKIGKTRDGSIVEQQPVCEQLQRETFLARAGDEVENVASEEDLSAGEREPEPPERGQFVNRPKPFGRRKFAAAVVAVKVAVRAPQIAAVGEFEHRPHRDVLPSCRRHEGFV